MTYWVTSSIQRNLKATEYLSSEPQRQVLISLANGKGTISTVVETDTVSLGELNKIVANYSITSLSTEEPENFNNISNVTTTTEKNSYSLYVDNINSSTYTLSLQIKDYVADNFFTNSSSYRKYIRSLKKDKAFVASKYFHSTFYPQFSEKINLNLDDYYVGLLLEFELNLAKIGDYTTFILYDNTNLIGNILINKTKTDVLFKSNSPFSSYMFLQKNNKFYSTTSEMPGVVFNLQETPNEKVLIKFFVFNSIFSNFYLEIVNSNEQYKNVKRIENSVREEPDTSTTTSTTMFFDAYKFPQQLVSINTTPIHFVLTAYRQ